MHRVQYLVEHRLHQECAEQQAQQQHHRLKFPRWLTDTYDLELQEARLFLGFPGDFAELLLFKKTFQIFQEDIILQRI